jgi:hypothetical protein
MKRIKIAPAFVLVALLLAALAPAGAAAAETRTYLNTEGFEPGQNGGLVGPATVYPAVVNVSGVGGTVTKVTLTAIDLNGGEDLDMALVGPNGAKVMLLSDTCTSKSPEHVTWTFEDAALFPVSEFGCPSNVTESVKPSDFGNPALDSFAVGGGPAGPFGTSLAAFNGISPNGEWKLYLLDDTEGRVGFELRAFALNLEIEPPLPAPPVVQTVTVPGPERIVKVPAKTGKRAAALAKCKKKATPEKKAKCRAAAKKLPV